MAGEGYAGDRMDAHDEIGGGQCYGRLMMDLVVLSNTRFCCMHCLKP